MFETSTPKYRELPNVSKISEEVWELRASKI